MAVEFWDKVKREQVDNFLRESMATKFVIKGVGNKKQITKVLKNDQNWKKKLSIPRTRYAVARDPLRVAI